MKEPRKPLYIKAKEYMLEKITGMVPRDNQLEPEHQLSGKLGMSRETIRKAMSTLIKDGFVSHWHGKGNFGHPEVTNLKMRMDINSDFRRILKSSGFQVEAIRSEPYIESPSADMLKRVPEAEGKEAVHFDLSFKADRKLAIRCHVELLKEYIREMPASGKYTENITDFLKKHCSSETSYTVAWLNAGLEENISREFGLNPATALLEWDEVYLDIYDQKLGFVKIFFNPDIMDLSLLLHF